MSWERKATTHRVCHGWRPKRRIRLDETRGTDRWKYTILDHPNPDRIGKTGNLSMDTLTRDYRPGGTAWKDACGWCGIRTRPEGGGMYMGPRKHSDHCPYRGERHRYRGPARLARDLLVGTLALPKGLPVHVVGFDDLSGFSVIHNRHGYRWREETYLEVHAVPVDALGLEATG